MKDALSKLCDTPILLIMFIILSGNASVRASGSAADPWDLSKQIQPEILESLRDIENIRITTYPGVAVVEGELLSTEDLKRVGEIAGSLDGVVNLCTLHRDALDVAAEYIQATMEKQGIKALKMEVVGKRLFLTGTPASPEEVELVTRICEAYDLPFLNGTKGNVDTPRMVTFEVNFTEINRQTLQDLGVTWPSSLTFTDPSGIRLSRLSPDQSLEVVVNVFAQHGKARIISKPRLVCRSGEKASFLAGVEIPIPRKDDDGNISVTWKRYGIILEVAPDVDANGKIDVLVTSEVSMVDEANSVEGIPGILTRKITTSLSLLEGQTVVLSGLVKTDDARNVRKVPLLGDIPILGELFRSEGFQKRETELIVFLTPQLTAAQGPEGDRDWPSTVSSKDSEWASVKKKGESDAGQKILEEHSSCGADGGLPGFRRNPSRSTCAGGVQYVGSNGP